MTYLLDANVFIQAKNLHYGFDFCPAYWNWIQREHATGKVFSIERVRDEMIGGQDDLANWVAALPPAFFLPADAAVTQQFPNVSAWASSQGFDPAAISIFLQVADFYLVAHAKAHNFTIVTHEVPASGAKKIKIPNACIALTIPCITPYDMLRRESARFVLGA
jgi:hypothetical protein